MEFRLEQTKNAKQEISQADNAQIRLFRMTPRASARPLAKVVFSDSLLSDLQAGKFYEPTSWQLCTSETAAKFSAVGYYFGKQLQQKLNVPIGLICNAVGGTTTQAISIRQVWLRILNYSSLWIKIGYKKPKIFILGYWNEVMKIWLLCYKMLRPIGSCYTHLQVLFCLIMA
jgi:hypothetical protein